VPRVLLHNDGSCNACTMNRCITFRCNIATGVNDTGGKCKKSSNINVLIILFKHLWEVELAYRYIFAFKFTLSSQQPDIVPIIATGVNDTGGKFAAGVVDTGGKFAAGVKPPVSLTPAANLPPVSLTPVANLPPVTTTQGKMVAKFATDVVDTGGAPWLANISANFRKNSKRS
jgi:hypothetical protein